MLERWANAAALFTVVFAVHVGVIALGGTGSRSDIIVCTFEGELPSFTWRPGCPCWESPDEKDECVLDRFLGTSRCYWPDVMAKPAPCWSDDGLCSDEELEAIVTGATYRPPIRVRSVHVPDQR
jgi:hypothetical protein